MALPAIPFGCKFVFEPEDHELLLYLSCKCNGEALPSEKFILDVDLYRLNDPGVLFEKTSEKVVYVFTKLKKMVKNGKRVERSVSGNRTWKGVDGGKPIYNTEGFLVGEKKNFVLVNKMKVKLGYNMTEFTLDNEMLKNSRFNDYVVCKIKKKAKKSKGLKFGDAQEEGICRSSVSTPSTGGDVMVNVAEEGHQYEDTSVALVNYQYQGEQAQELQQLPESNEEVMGNFMPMVCEGFDGHQELSNSEFYQLLFQEEHANEEDTIPSCVSTPAIEDVKGSVTEEVHQKEDNSVALPQYQCQGEQAQEFHQFQESNEYQFTESVEGMSNSMPMVCEGFDGGDLFNPRLFRSSLSEEYSLSLEEINSWMPEITFAPNQYQQ